ncbi:PREDICTED: dihydrofolate reductase [Ceratosolen solmsi marchali]|uniref:dihydrofolate reductase n=1 Tax=Ceratosolen solmsi marchali TaxID=326594 RepID=A0AAJ6YE75_9HYME|nr:PREDICTED: dihydrofolate reductase [Ceratosolen solmsi marchali]
MQVKLKLIAAASENMGIGINGELPWRLKKEMDFFTRMTTTTKDSNKQNAVIMGRRTWECIPKKYKPLANRINMVLSSQSLDYGEDVVVCKSLPDMIEKLSQSPLNDKIEQVWVIGGSSIYKISMESPNFYRLYLTRVKKHFKCDTFFPEFPDNFVLVKDSEVPEGIQEEKGIQYEYEVYEREN